MPHESVEKVCQRAKRAWDEKNLWQPALEDAYKYAFPGRNLYLETSPGQLKNETVYDSTLVASAQRAVNLYHTELFPPSESWANIVPGQLWTALARKEDEVTKVQAALDDLTKVCFGLLNSSNFDTSIDEFLSDWVISTGIMLANPGDDNRMIDFCCIPLYQVALENGAYGHTCGIFRNFKMKARDIEPTWRKMEFKAPADWAKTVGEKPNEPIDVLEATYYDYKDLMWNYEVIIKGKFGETGSFVRAVEKVYKVNPWIVTPFTKVAGESLGRGPVLLALPDARVLNKTKELTLQAASLAIFPPMTVIDDGVINFSTVKLVPGAPIPVGRNDGSLGPSIKPLVTGENFDVSEIIIADHQGIVRRTMNDDTLPPQGGAVRSATEYMARLRDGQRNAAPRARLLTDFYRPLFQIVLDRADQLNLVAPIMEKHGFAADTIKIDGMFADLSIKSPLFQSRNLDRLDAISAALQMGAALGQEAMMIGLKIEDLMAEIWNTLALPAKYLRTEEERAEMQANMAKVIAAQQQGAPAAA